MLLNTSSESLSLITGATGSVDYNVSYRDSPGSPGDTQSSQGNVTTATTTTVVAAPETRKYRTILDVFVRNKHASSIQTVTLAKTVSGTDYYLTPSVTLLAGESLHYSMDKGLSTFDSTGRIKTTGVKSASSSLLMSPTFMAVNHSDTRTIGPGWTQATYVGKAPRALDYITTRLRVTTAVSAGASEWCEVAIAKGAVNPGGNPTLTVVGWTSAETALASIGMHNVIVSVKPTYSIQEDDDIWLLVGASAAVNPIIRAAGHDIIQTGAHAIVSNRPSAIIGTATAYTIAPVSTSTAWIAGII